MRTFKPQTGGKVYASALHPFLSFGDFVGHIIKVDDKTLVFKSQGESHHLIWNFGKGDLNKYHDFVI